MIKISRKVEYSLMVLRYMGSAPEGQIISAREICDQFNIPFDTTAKVMQAMNNKDILSSIKGLHGGYVLKSNLKKMTYMELVEMVEGKVAENYCYSHQGLCNLHSTCNIVGPVDALNRKIQEYLSNLSVYEILFSYSELHSPLKEALKHEY